jgi:hypothetical protein
MAYTEIKTVRAMNGQQFIDDFKRLRTIVVWCSVSKTTFVVQRWEVWAQAKRKKIEYLTSTDVYANGREVIIIT